MFMLGLLFSVAGQQKSGAFMWPKWAKGLTLIGVCLILFFFVDVPIQQLSSVEVLLDNQNWQLPAVGVFWNVELQINETVFVNLEVSGDLQVIFYFKDASGERWVNMRTGSFSQNWTVPASGEYTINIDNPYVQERPTGTISVTRYMAIPEYKIVHPFRLLQIGLLFVGIAFLSIGLSAYPRIRRNHAHS